MITSIVTVMLVAVAPTAWAQLLPSHVPETEVFTREEIGHAISEPTPQAGRTAANPANAPQDDGQWTMPAKNYAATRYSAMNEISFVFVCFLQVVFSFLFGVTKGEEAAPLVVDNTMYVVTAYPNYLYALDLTKPGAPLKW